MSVAAVGKQVDASRKGHDTPTNKPPIHPTPPLLATCRLVGKHPMGQSLM